MCQFQQPSAKVVEKYDWTNYADESYNGCCCCDYWRNLNSRGVLIDSMTLAKITNVTRRVSMFRVTISIQMIIPHDL